MKCIGLAIFVAVGISLPWIAHGKQGLRHAANYNHADASQTQAEANRKRDQLMAYFMKRRSQMKVIATTVTDNGQVIDWIDPKVQLPKGQALATPPPLSPTDTTNKQSQPKLNNEAISTPEVMLELHQQPHARGPEGTVPMLRHDVIIARLKDEDLPKSVGDYFIKRGSSKSGITRHSGKHGESIKNKTEDVATNSTQEQSGHQHHRGLQSSVHKYVSTEEQVSNFGGEASINIWSPYVQHAGEFSLGQVAVSAGSTIQTVECGWQVDQGHYGDTYSHIFTYFTTDGYSSSGNSVGGYNLEQSGFVQVSNSIFPGAVITSQSVTGGAQYSMQVKVQLYQGNWWVSVFGQWIGYYPAQLYAVESGGLSNGASAINWYGEIVDNYVNGQATETRMGSGAYASAGFQNAAYIRNILTYRFDCNCASDYTPQYQSITNSNCYSYDGHLKSGTTWGSYFYFGGPGASFGNTNCT